MSFKKLRRQHAERAAQQATGMAYAIGKTLEGILTQDRLEALHYAAEERCSLDGLCEDLYRLTGFERPQ